MDDLEYKEFKKEFWVWFDSLPYQHKAMFWNYKEDMAETNYYFSVYNKNINKN